MEMISSTFKVLFKTLTVRVLLRVRRILRIHGFRKSKKSIMGPENVDDVDEAFRAITNAQYTASLRVFER